ncbi:response regulator transcription factor [Rhizorhabdus dicambivorans]|uniref:Response regulator receiver protein n=1 Tax=Rhizorhabdus dicambivorans TaxID=1850238 RepID=A0A2A4FXT7_9SPHN|nr:response regulator [Rhizorhabdus dicambivorans]ATE63087.1 response regulator receiver protein [Rhizorhabdus dicambivorans]PCE43264.1 response regulator receiver protein [Rhizorhabdus dicambivorans]
MTAGRLLYVVDDEAIVRASIVSLVQAHGAYECREFANGDAFLSVLDGLEPGCVVLDLQLDGASGVTAMRALAERPDRFRTIVVTGFSDLSIAIEAFRAGVVDFLHKPYEIRPLLDALDRGFHLLEQGSEPPALVAGAKALVARLGGEEAELFARLIRGETNEEIGRALRLDARAVQIVRARVLSTLEAPSVLAAIRIAALAGWLDRPAPRISTR